MTEGNKWSTYQLYQKPVDSGWAQVGFEILVWRGHGPFRVHLYMSCTLWAWGREAKKT